MDSQLSIRKERTDLGETVKIESQDIGAKYIVAQMVQDHVEPYASRGNLIPRVIKSNHPKYSVGTRLDYGFLITALNEGYAVAILPENLRSNII